MQHAVKVRWRAKPKVQWRFVWTSSFQLHWCLSVFGWGLTIVLSHHTHSNWTRYPQTEPSNGGPSRGGANPGHATGRAARAGPILRALACSPAHRTSERWNGYMKTSCFALCCFPQMGIFMRNALKWTVAKLCYELKLKHVLYIYIRILFVLNKPMFFLKWESVRSPTPL